MDTVTLVRSALRGLLAASAGADAELAAGLRAAVSSGDDYAAAGHPQIDWDDPAAREAEVAAFAVVAAAIAVVSASRSLCRRSLWRARRCKARGGPGR